MTLEEFHKLRKPFYLDPDTLLVKFPTQKHMDCSHAVWFTEMGYPYIGTIRGYYYKTDEDEFIMIYTNNFAVPNLTIITFNYLFEYFPTVKWVGVGCIIGEIGDIWKPQIVVKRGI